MAAFSKFEENMEEERLKEERKAKEEDLVTSHPPLLPREPYAWLMITDMENGSDRHIFYSITEDRYYVRFVKELQNKHVACCYGGWLVLRDNSSDDCSILNILTMETLQLPPLNIPPHHKHIYFQKCKFCTDCVMSSPVMDKSCRVIFIDREPCKFWSCHIGDSEFIERELTYKDGIHSDFVNFKGKLYALTAYDFNLITFDYTDPELHHEQVISGESLPDFIFFVHTEKIFLVESGEDLLLIFMGITGHDNEVSNVKIFRADFSVGEWVILETLGDRAIFLGLRNNTFSSCALAVGMKGNAIYWVRTSVSWAPPERNLYMYDMEDKSLSVSLPFPIVENHSSLYWVSLPITCNEEKKREQTNTSYLFEACPIETDFHVQHGKATKKSTNLLIEQRKTQKREETKAIVRKENLWADLPNDLLLELFPHLFAGDTIAFRSVCRSWYSLSPPRTTQQFVHPLKSSNRSTPFLMCPDNKMYDPIHGELYSMDFPNKPWATVRAARDGWLLMDFDTLTLFFYNPFTKEEIQLPDSNARFYYSVYFSGPPTSADCLVVVAARMLNGTDVICFKKLEDEGWTCREISLEKESFCFHFCNAVVYKGLYYFLGCGRGRFHGFGGGPYGEKLLFFNPMKDEVSVIEDPKLNSGLFEYEYLLESDGKLIAVFVGTDGSSVHTFEWNFSTCKWEILGSLGSIMLFVSRPLSICKKATVSGTGNKIYFPRVVGDDGQILFYSLATKRYHTFEMGSSYSNFFTTKFYPEYNGWFMP